MMPNDPNQHWQNLNNQVSQYQQASNMNQPQGRQVMAPQDRQLAERQSNDNFTLGAMNVFAQREGNRMQADASKYSADAQTQATKYAADSQERTWAQKNQLDFDNAERDRQWQQQNIDKEREEQNKRSAAMAASLEKLTKARLESLTQRGEQAEAQIKQLNQYQREYDDLVAANLKGEVEWARQYDRNVQAPIDRERARLQGVQSHTRHLVDVLSPDDSALSLSIQGLVEGIIQNQYTEVASPGFFGSIGRGFGFVDSDEDLRPPDTGNTNPLLGDYGIVPRELGFDTARWGTPRTRDDMVDGPDSGISIKNIEGMSRKLARGLSTSLQNLGATGGDTTPVVESISRIIASAAMGMNNSPDAVRKDFTELASQLQRLGVSPHVVPVIFGQMHGRLVSAATDTRKALVDLVPSLGSAAGVVDERGMLPIFRVQDLSAVDAEDWDDTKYEVYKYNAMARMANAVYASKTRASASGQMMDEADIASGLAVLDSLTEQVPSFADAFSDTGGSEFDRDTIRNLFQRALPAGIGGNSHLQGMQDFLFGIASDLEGLGRDVREHRAGFRRQTRGLDNAMEALRLRMGTDNVDRAGGMMQGMASLLGSEGFGNLTPEQQMMMMALLEGGGVQ